MWISNRRHRHTPPSRKYRVAVLVAAISLGAGSCADLDQYVRGNSAQANCITGGLLGAVTGALVGAAAKGDRKTIAGAAVAGGVAGCVIAVSYKNRLDYLHQLAREEHLQIQTDTLQLADLTTNDTPREVGLAVQVQDQGMFPVGSSIPSADGERQIRALASAFADLDPDQAVLVVGHTDATGSAQGNQRLSEQRARAVAGLLAEQGIDRNRMYFQGAGASRPIADNADPALRGQNRRVEIVLVDDVTTLAKRAESERNNPSYLAHGTSTEPAPAAVAERPAPATPKSTHSTAPASRTPATRAPLIDFGGGPVAASDWSLARLVTPKRSGISLISGAHASNLPLASCAGDSPRISGEVKHLASGRVLNAPATRDYLPGMNGRAWAGLANGHLVTLSPVSVLREGAVLTQPPKVYITRDYAQNPGQASHTLTASANTFEGEDSILYRVFVGDVEQKPLHCLDVVLPKNGERSLGANLVYAHGTEPYAADLTLLRN